MGKSIDKNIEKEFEKSNEEVKENHLWISKVEAEGIQNILKHFDRIHDKLFNFNNILIVGYFTLSKIYGSISVLNILIPICNLFILIYIEYRMMEKSRFESKITEKPLNKINDYGRRINNTTLFSLLSFFSTFCVTGMFLYYLFR